MEQKPNVEIILPNTKILGLTIEQFKLLLGAGVVLIILLIIALILMERKWHGLRNLIKRPDKS